MKTKFKATDIAAAVKYLNDNASPKPPWIDTHYSTKDGKLYNGRLEVVPFEDRNTIVQSYYTNPTYSGGRDRLYEHLSEKYAGISRRAVASFLKNSETHQLLQPLPRRTTARRLIVRGPNVVAQIDLVDMQELKGWNQRQRYILTYVDLFSKFGAAQPLPNKTAEAVQAGLKIILESNNCSTIQADNGPEFGKSLAIMLKAMDIKLIHSTPYNPRANGAVERFNRTIKTSIYRLFHANETKNWVDMLQRIVAGYNDTTHSSTLWKPADLKVAELSKSDIEKIQTHMRGPDPADDGKVPVYHVGDKVRLALTVYPAERRNAFRKKIKENWTASVFEVVTVSQPVAENTQPQYTVKNLETNRNWARKLWSYQLQKVDPATLIKTERKAVPAAAAAGPKPDDSSDDEKEVAPREHPKRERKAPAPGMQRAAASKLPAPAKAKGAAKSCCVRSADDPQNEKRRKFERVLS